MAIAQKTSSTLPVEGCQGYDTVFCDVRNAAVRGQRCVEGAGVTSEMHYKVCQGVEEVRSTLQIAESSILSFFKAGSHLVSDKLRFFDSLNLTSHSVAIVVYSKIVTGGHTFTDVSLSVPVPQSHEMQTFVSIHGDSYVSKVLSGAEYYASFTYHAMTLEEKMDLLAKMKKHGLFSWGAAGDVSDFNKKIIKFNSVQNVCVEFCQSMRGISGISLPKPSHLLDFVLKLPTRSVDNPQIIHIESLGYEHAHGFTVPYFNSVIRARSVIVQDSSFLYLLSKVKGLEIDVQAIEAMLRGQGMYKGNATAFLDKVKGALKVDRASVQAMMQQYKSIYFTDIVLIHLPASFKSLEYEGRVQASHWTEVQSTYLGGGGGDAREYVTNIGEFMRSSRRIVSIQLRSGGWIDKIKITYNNGDTFESGGNGGRWSTVLRIPEGVYFSKIRIKDNKQFVSYLEFVLTNGNSLHGGNVKSGGGKDVTYEPYKTPEYHYFCGFEARSGGYVDAVRAIFAKFKI